MLVTGNRILDALDFLKERVKTLEAQFTASLFTFEGEEPPRTPQDLMRELVEVNERIARLYEVQAAYNLQVQVDVQGEALTLQRVLQLVAAANRVKSLWAKAAAPEQENPYAFGQSPRQRDRDNEYAQRVVPLGAAQELADAATRRALAFKQAIRSGNAREVEMDIAAEIFEV